MLKFDQLTLRRGARVLLNEASFSLHASWRVGITGRNGAGKSSLLALVTGHLSPDAGHFSRPTDWVLAQVHQEMSTIARTALDYALDGDREFRHIEHALKEAETTHDAIRQATLHERLHAIGGYAAPARAAELLHGLGFTSQDAARNITEFSGGWRMRLNLAQALMTRSDLLLLDEPTNHLDLDAVFWLEDWLRRYPGTLLVVSHDREFLDAVVTHVLHLADTSAEIFSGNVSTFERKRAERLGQQHIAHERQQRERARLQSFVDRFRAKATKARQAQSRVKALERMTEIAAVRVESGIDFDFPKPAALPNPLLVLNDTAVGYGTRTILQQLKLALRPGERIGLLGANGAGKSTLVKLIAGVLAPVSGQRIDSKGLTIGYFAQHQLEQLHLDATPVQHLLRADPRLGEQAARNFLGTFGFSGERALAQVDEFSGGEKARLALALIVFQRPNLLLLDEPTNHLDLDTREALAEALQDFAGAVVLVAHDRGLLRACCDEYLLVHDGCVSPFEGDLDDYARLVLRRDANNPNTSPKSESSRREQRRERAEQRARLAPLRKEIARIEHKLSALENTRKEIQNALANAAIYEDDQTTQVAELIHRQGQIKNEITQLETAWLDTHASIELAEQ